MMLTHELLPDTVDRDTSVPPGGAASLHALERRLAPYFERAEARRRAMAYLRGLLCPAERKNSWPLAEIHGDATPYAFQHLLRRALWDREAVRDALRRRTHRLHKRAARSAHSQHTASPYHLCDPWGRIAAPQNRRGRIERVEHRCVQKHMAVDVALVEFYAPLRTALARSIETTAQGHAPVSGALLRTMPGGGTILALVMLDSSSVQPRAPTPG